MPTRVLLTLLLAVLGVLAPVTSGLARTPSASERGPDPRPNVVLIMTDDMAASDLRWMPRTRRLLGRAGTTFDQGLAPNPMCCPARATVLTGQESHNNGVWSNSQPHGGYSALQPGTQLPDWLQQAGYRTAFLGKHLNGLRTDDAAREDGWDVFDPLVRGVYSYRSFVTWDDGAMTPVRDGYVTDHLSDRARQVIRGFETDDSAPFFAWISHVGPHNARDNRCTARGCWKPPVPARADRGDFAGVASPSREVPSFNHRNGPAAPPFLRGLDPVHRDYLDLLFQRRVEALQSVDRSVAATVGRSAAAVSSTGPCSSSPPTTAT